MKNVILKYKQSLLRFEHDVFEVTSTLAQTVL
jgi:hypothetical protein